MIYIVSHSNDPFFNLAAEEYLFRKNDVDVFFVYINTPLVVVGKHQNALAEVNALFLYENNIPLLRRLSGGGAVYHDLGNVNFSFIQTVPDVTKVNYANYSSTIVAMLRKLGVDANVGKRNDLFVEGFKISGHASHIFRNRVLSHGTLLFDSDRQNLSEALKLSNGKYESRAISSVRSKVENISHFLDKSIEINEFVSQIYKQVSTDYPGIEVVGFTADDIFDIERLAKEKYERVEWNYCYSPGYIFTNELALPNGQFATCNLSVEKGRIISAEIESFTVDKQLLKQASESLIGIIHYPGEVVNRYNPFFSTFLSREEFLGLIF
jgi:lipoate---protein ligase